MHILGVVPFCSVNYKFVLASSLGLRTASLTLCIQYAVAEPVYPDPTMITSVSDGSSPVDGKALNSGSAASIQYDFDGFLTGRTIMSNVKKSGQTVIRVA